MITGLLMAVATIAYIAMGDALQDEIDSGLRFRAVSALAHSHADRARRRPDPRLQEPTEAFDQVLTRTGRVLRRDSGLHRTAADARGAGHRPRPDFLEPGRPERCRRSPAARDPDGAQRPRRRRLDVGPDGRAARTGAGAGRRRGRRARRLPGRLGRRRRPAPGRADPAQARRSPSPAWTAGCQCRAPTACCPRRRTRPRPASASACPG